MESKRIILAGLFCTALFSCKEKEPLSTNTNTLSVKDTTYVAAVETQAPRIVLVEDATGVKCPNCPAGAEILKQAEEQNPGRIVVVGEHGGSLTNPIAGVSRDTFGLDDVKLLFNTYFGGEPNKPATAIDRIYRNSSYFVEARNTWLSLISDRLSVLPIMNLSVSSVYQASSNEYYITIKGSYTGTTSKKQRLTIMLTESNIIDAQDDGVEVITDYEHDHVLRAFLTNYSGLAILTDVTSKEAGRVFEKTIVYKIPDNKLKWKVENLDVVAFVHNDEGLDKDVQQSAISKLKP